MVWEDLMRTSIESQYSYNHRSWGYPADCDEPALWLANMRDCVLRLRGHPSLLVWCGSNEDPPPKYLGVPMQDKILPELDGTRPWLPSSSAEPDWAKESDAGLERRPLEYDTSARRISNFTPLRIDAGRTMKSALSQCRL